MNHQKIESLRQILLTCANDDDVPISDTVTAVLGLFDCDTGKTLRDEFAMAALTGMIARPIGKEIDCEQLYAIADAMIEARKTD